MSVDTWLVVGSMQRELERLARHVDDHATSDRDEATTSVLNALLHGLLSLSGLASESMVRDLGWQFMETGRRIERALHVTALVGSALSTERSAPVESLVVESVLIAGESIITSRRRHRTRALTSTTIGLLFDDGGNPRSLRFQLDRLADESRAVCTTIPAGRHPRRLDLLGQVRTLLDAHRPLERSRGRRRQRIPPRARPVRQRRPIDALVDLRIAIEVALVHPIPCPARTDRPDCRHAAVRAAHPGTPT